MSFQVRRPIKLSHRVRRNFARLDWTSIGLRGAHSTVRKLGTRKKPASPGSGLSYAHSEKSRCIGLREAANESPSNTRAPTGKDWRGLFWIALIALAIAAAALRATP